jgi:hypothetical protein
MLLTRVGNTFRAAVLSPIRHGSIAIKHTRSRSFSSLPLMEALDPAEPLKAEPIVNIVETKPDLAATKLALTMVINSYSH